MYPGKAGNTLSTLLLALGSSNVTLKIILMSQGGVICIRFVLSVYFRKNIIITHIFPYVKLFSHNQGFDSFNVFLNKCYL